MFAVVYTWKVSEGREQQFIDAWSELTLIIRQDLGGLGSCLHQGVDRTWFAYALWPSEKEWKKPKRNSYRMIELKKLMSEVSEELYADVYGDIYIDMIEHRIK